MIIRPGFMTARQGRRNIELMSATSLDSRWTFSRASSGTYLPTPSTLSFGSNNVLLRSSEMTTAPWTALGGLVLSNVAGPSGATNGWSGTLVNAGARFYNQCSGLMPSYRYEPSFWINPVSTSGTLKVENPANASNGLWLVDVSLLLAGSWQRITRSHPSVSISIEFTSTVSGLSGVYFYPSSGSIAASFAQAQVDIGPSSTGYNATSGSAYYGPRFEPNYGYLNEPQATNLLLQSNSVGTSPWGAVNSNTSYVVTQNNAVAPDGTTTATRIAASAVSGAQYAFHYQGASGTVASYTKSIWLKGAVGGETVYLASTLGTTSYTRTLCALTTSWQRFTVADTETIATWYLYVGVDLRDAGQVGVGAQTYFVWGGQCELGGFATSLIPTTTGTVTRAADNATFDMSQVPSIQTAAGYGFAVDFSVLGTSQNSAVIAGLCDGSGFTNSLYASLNGSGQLVLTCVIAGSGASSSVISLNAVGATNKLAVSVTSAGLRLAVNGVLQTAIVNAGLVSMTTMAIGRAPWGANNYSGCHFTRDTLVPGPQSDGWLISRSL